MRLRVANAQGMDVQYSSDGEDRVKEIYLVGDDLYIQRLCDRCGIRTIAHGTKSGFCRSCAQIVRYES